MCGYFCKRSPTDELIPYTGIGSLGSPTGIFLHNTLPVFIPASFIGKNISKKDFYLGAHLVGLYCGQLATIPLNTFIIKLTSTKISSN